MMTSRRSASSAVGKYQPLSSATHQTSINQLLAGSRALPAAAATVCHTEAAVSSLSLQTFRRRLKTLVLPSPDS